MERGRIQGASWGFSHPGGAGAGAGWKLPEGQVPFWGGFLVIWFFGVFFFELPLIEVKNSIWLPEPTVRSRAGLGCEMFKGTSNPARCGTWRAFCLHAGVQEMGRSYELTLK